MDRGHDYDHDDKGKGKDGAECIAFEKVLIGPVCVEVEDVIADILTS